MYQKISNYSLFLKLLKKWILILRIYVIFGRSWSVRFFVDWHTRGKINKDSHGPLMVKTWMQINTYAKINRYYHQHMRGLIFYIMTFSHDKCKNEISYNFVLNAQHFFKNMDSILSRELLNSVKNIYGISKK